MSADELERVALQVQERLRSIRCDLSHTEDFALTRSQHEQMNAIRLALTQCAADLQPRTTLADCRQRKGRGYVGGEDNPSSCPNFHTDGNS